jgi:hypothetical protein
LPLERFTSLRTHLLTGIVKQQPLENSALKTKGTESLCLHIFRVR